MPTPDDAMVSPVEHESITGRATCPPDESRASTAHELSGPRQTTHDSNASPARDAPMQQPTPPPHDEPDHGQPPADAHSKPSTADIEAPARDIPTPMTATDEGTDEQRPAQPSPQSTITPVSLLANHISSPFLAHRVRSAVVVCRAVRCAELTAKQFLPNTSSSLLRPGSRFVGSQTSDRQKYEVEVEIKHVDMRESFMCGYLRIKGTHPRCCHAATLGGRHD